MKLIKLTIFAALFQCQALLAAPSASRQLTGSTIKNGAATITLPTVTGALCGIAESCAITNKTINGSSNTISNIGLTSQVTGVLPIANGGTNNGSLGVDAGGVYYSDGSKLVNLAHGSSGSVLTSGGTGAPTWTASLVNPMTTGGDLIYGGSAGAATRLANGSSGQVLQSAGGTSAPAWQTLAGNATALKAPTVQVFTATGTRAAVQFTISAASCNAGAVLSNNGNNYTVLQTISGGTTLYASGSGAPLSSGTLTYVSGTCAGAPITFSAKTDLALYTPPSSPAPLYVKVKGVGGGGGGGSSGTAGTNSGNTGKPSILIPSTTFTNVIMSLGGGNGGGNAGGSGQSGGDPTINVSATVLLLESAGGGGGGGALGAATTQWPGGVGGGSAFGGGANSVASGASGTAKTNTGAGGAGGGTGGTASSFPGSGGGAGAYGSVMLVGAGVGSMYYAVGVKGTGGTAGTSGNAGGDGADGLMVFEEHYQ